MKHVRWMLLVDEGFIGKTSEIVAFNYYIIRFLSFKVFPPKLPVLLKEHELGMYRESVYFVCNMIAEV